MDKYCFLLLMLLGISGSSQSRTFIDQRDGKTYGAITIDGITWMNENLNYETSLSKSIDDIEREVDSRLKGRWYHQNELTDICPAGWRLPSVNDWIHYLDYLSVQKRGKYKAKLYEEDIQVRKFDKYFSLFEKNNPLGLISTGIFEGGHYRFPMGYQADYWIQDLETNENLPYYVEKVYKGKSHIHLHDPFTQIHSHDHHLDTSDEASLRLFMVRCVCKE